MTSFFKNNSFLSFAGTLTVAVSGFGSMLVLIRTQSPNDFGQWTLYLTVYSLLDMMRSGLIQTGLIRFWAETKDNAYTGAALVLSTLFTLTSMALLTFIGIFFHFNDLITFQLPILLTVTIPYSLGLWQRQAENRFSSILWIRAAFALPFLLIGISAFRRPLSIGQIAAIQTVLYFFISLFTFDKHLKKPSSGHLKKLWNYGKYSIGTLLGTNLLKSSDTFFIGTFLNSSAVAMYQFPYKLIEIIEIPLRSQVAALLPRWANLPENQAFDTMKKAALKLTLMLVPVSLGCYLSAEILLTVLGGRAYQASAPLLKVFAVYSLFLPFDRLLGVALDAIGKPQLNTIKVGTMLLVNVLGDAIVLTFGGELWMVAAVTIVTIAVGVAVGFYFLKQQKQTSMPLHTHSAPTSATNSPLVSIITINYDQPQITAQLLESLRKITYSNVEIWVVDNNSPNRSTDAIAPFFPEVKFLKSTTNVGFAGGNNLAAQQARGEYLLFINNDVEVAPGFLEPLVERLQSDRSIGMVSPKIKYFDAPDTLQYAGCSEINLITGQGHFIGHRETDGSAFSQSAPTAYIHGAAMLVTRQVLTQTGFMDDDYFLYYEELDWCARARRDGFNVWYVAESEVWHKESMSTGKESPLKVYFQTRNRLKFLRKNGKLWQQFVGLGFILGVALPKNILMYRLKKRSDLAQAALSGAADYLLNRNAFLSQ
ncbi:MAG: glycosyltransferase [Spirosomataceae bacterium]